jgi:hypothetical protein
MPTVRDMVKANDVITKLAANPNLFITTAFKLLPIMAFLAEVVQEYLETKEKVIAEDSDIDEKELQLNNYLDAEITIPDTVVGVSTLRNCGLTMVDLQHINWWVVEFADEYED